MIQKSIPPTSADEDHPYLGLFAFKEIDAAYFHGRSREAAELFQLVRRGTLTVVYGMSGLGKTSLLHAGLFPRLRQGRYLPVPVRLTFPAGEVDLVAQIRAAVKLELEAQHIDAAAPLDGETLWGYFHRVTFWDEKNHPLTVTLVLDQFEEIFTLGAGRREVDDLVTALGDLVENRIPEAIRRRPAEGRDGEDGEGGEDVEEMPPSYDRPRVKVILAMREEFLPRLDELRPRIGSIGLMSNWYHLRRMNGERAHEAVLGPARHLIDHDVATQIVRFVAAADENARRRPDATVKLEDLEIEPALLSLVCAELNQRRLGTKQAKITAALLTGESSRVLASFYERCMADLGNRVRAFVEERLLTVGGDYRTTVALTDAISAPGMSVETVETLVERRLLRLEDRLEIPHVELIHDRMIAVLRDSRQQRRERERRRRNLRRAFGLVLLLTAAATALGWFILGRVRDQQERLIQLEQSRNVARQLQESGRQALLDGDAGTAAHLLAYADRFARLADGPTPALGVLLSRALHGLDAQVAVLAPGSAGAVQDVRYSPDGKLIATLGADGVVRLWDASTGKPHGTIEEPAPPEVESRRRPEAQARQAPEGAAGDPLAQRPSEPLPAAESCRKTPVTSIGWSKESRLLTLAKDGCGAVWSTRDCHLLKSFKRKATSLVWKRESDRFALCDETSCSIMKVDESGEGVDVHAEREIHHRSGDTDPRARLDVLNASDLMAYRRLQGEDPSPELMAYLRRRRDVDPRIRFVSLAYGGRHMATVGADNTARVWDLESGEQVLQITHGEDINDAAWSQDGKWFATSSDDRTVRVFEVDRRRQVATLPHAEPVEWIAFDRASTNLVSVSLRGVVTVWDATKGTRLLDVAHSGDVQPFASFSHDGKRIVTLASTGTIDVWNSQSGVQTHSLRNPTARPGRRVVADVAPDGDQVVTGGADGLARVWDIGVKSPTPSERILSAGYAGDAAPLARLKAHEGGVDAIAFNPKKPQMATGGWDGKAKLVKLGDLPADAEIDASLEHDEERAVADVEYSSDGALVVTASIDRTARVWDAATGKRLQILGRDKHEDVRVSRRAVFRPDTRQVATAGLTGRSCLWEAESGKRIRCFEDPKHESYAAALAFDRAGSVIAVAYEDGAVLLYDVESGRVLLRLEEHERAVDGVEIDATGTHVLTASVDGTARIWSIAGGKLLGSVPLAHDDAVRSAHFGPSGRVVTASADGTAKVWHASGKLARTLRGHTAALVEASFSPDEQLVLTASIDGTARLWETETGLLLASFEGHAPDFMLARFMPDRPFVVTADHGGDVRFWRLPSARDAHGGAIVQARIDDHAAFLLDEGGCTMRWDLAPPGPGSGSAVCLENVVAPGIMTGGPWTAVGGQDATFVVWGSDGGARLTQLRGVGQPLRAVGLDAKDGRLMTVDARLHLGTWNLGDFSNLTDVPLRHQKPVETTSDAQFTKDGRRIVTASEDGTVTEWDSRTFQPMRELTGTGGPLQMLDVTAAGHVMGAGKQGLWVWRSTGDQPLFRAQQRNIDAVAISPDGTRVALGADGHVNLWDVESRQRLQSGWAHMNGTVGLSFDPTGERLLSYVGKPPAILWNARTGARVAELADPGGEWISYVSWAPRGDMLVTVGRTGRALVWDAHEHKTTRALFHGGSGLSASFSHDGRSILTTGSNGEMKIWEVEKESTKPAAVIETESPGVLSAVFSPDDSKIAGVVYADSDKESSYVGIWDATTTKTMPSLPRVKGIIDRVRWSPDGSQILSLSTDHVPRVWDVAAQNELHAFDFERVIAGAFTPSGPRVVTGDAEGMVRVYGAWPGGEPDVLTGDKKRIAAAALSPDGGEIVIGGDDGSVVLWTISQRTRSVIAEGRGKEITGVAWSPNAKRFVTASQDGKANLWRKDDGALVAELSGHTKAITGVRFDPAGDFVITASEDGTARVWQG